MSSEAPPDDGFERLWQEFLEKDLNRFRSMHQRARADAGPSLMGGARGIDHWTYDWARRATLYSLQEASVVILGYAERMDVQPADLVQRARPALAEHYRSMSALLEDDITGPPANEFAVRPSREALAEVERFMRNRSERAMAAVARGRVDEELEVKASIYGGLVSAVGGGQRLLLYLAAVLFLIAMWWAL